MANKDRFGPIIIVAEPGYAFQDEVTLAQWAEETQRKPSKLCKFILKT